MEFGVWIKREYQEQKIKPADLVHGMMSRTAFVRLLKGEYSGSFLMQELLRLRLGIAEEDIERTATQRDLERWTKREKICASVTESLLAPGGIREEALRTVQEQIVAYRSLVSGKAEKEGTCDSLEHRLEKQFFDKLEWLLLAGQSENASVSQQAQAIQRAAALTGVDLERPLHQQFLSPPELEILLMWAISKMRDGQIAAAWELWKQVWDYPDVRSWEVRVRILIRSQTVLTGYHLVNREEKGIPLWSGGWIQKQRELEQAAWEALQDLRHVESQRYLIPLLKCLAQGSNLWRNEDGSACVEAAWMGSYEKHWEQLGTECFCAAEYPVGVWSVSHILWILQELFRQTKLSEDRLWQSVRACDVTEAGTELRMLRMARGLSVKTAVRNEDGTQWMDERHLRRIEEGKHKIGLPLYRKLLKRYQRLGDWEITMLEDASANQLRMLQGTKEWIRRGCFAEARTELQYLIGEISDHGKKQCEDWLPGQRQTVIYLQALLQRKKNEICLNEYQEKLREALFCTIPDGKENQPEVWPYHRTETEILCSLIRSFREGGELKKATALLEKMQVSRKDWKGLYGGSLTVTSLLQAEDQELLGAKGLHRRAIRQDWSSIRELLVGEDIRGLDEILYDIAWNWSKLYQKEGRKNQKQLVQKWFLISEEMAAFLCETNMCEALAKQREPMSKGILYHVDRGEIK